MKDDEMYRHPRLHQRGGTFYFRAKVPLDLLHAYPGLEIKFSLRTKDRKQALQLVQLESLRVEREFEKLRSEQLVAHAPLTLVTSIDQEFITGITTSFLRDALEVDTDIRTGDMGDLEREIRQEGLEQQMQALREANRTGRVELIDSLLKVFLRIQGFELRVSDVEYRRLALAFLQAYTKSVKSLAQRDEGEIVETEELAPAAKALLPRAVRQTQQQLTWTALFEKWRDATARRPKTADEFKRVLAEFEKFIKDTPPASVDKQQVIAYRDHLLKEVKQAAKTVDKKISILRTIFRRGVSDSILDSDPTLGVIVTMPTVQKKSRISFTTNELIQLFGSDIFTGKSPKLAKFGAASYWVPMIGLFTGARIEEICQLRASEIKEEPDLGKYFHITDEGEGSTVKTEASRRRVPIHQRLFEAGLLEYVKSLPDQDGYLFPSLTPDKYGRRSSGLSKSFNAYLRNPIGIIDSRKVFHSFRHTFKHLSRELSIPEDVHDALTGHTGSGEGRKYGNGNEDFPTAPLFEAMKKIDFKGLTLQNFKAENFQSEKLTKRTRKTKSTSTGNFK